MLKIAFIYPKSNTYLRDGHPQMTFYNFFLKGLPENKRISYVPMRVDSPIDVSHLTNFDAMIFWSCAPSVLDIIGIEKLKCVKCVYGQDPIDMGEVWHAKYDQCEFDFVFFHGMKKAYPRHCNFPKSVRYESIMTGVDVRYYPDTDFVSRRRDKILCVGSYGNSDTVLRSMMVEAPQVEYVSGGAGYVGNRFNELLNQYQAVCTSMTYFIVHKYVELPMAGCLTFMGANEYNGVEELGFVDGESCVYVTVENYRQKFDEYLNTVDDSKWEQIATAGKRHAEETWSNEVQVNKLIDILEKYV